MSLPPVVCRRVHVFTSSCLQEGSCLIYVIFVCLRIVVSNTYCVVFFALFFVVLCLVYPMLPVSLDCPFLIAPSAFSNLYFINTLLVENLILGLRFFLFFSLSFFIFLLFCFVFFFFFLLLILYQIKTLSWIYNSASLLTQKPTDRHVGAPLDILY